MQTDIAIASHFSAGPFLEKNKRYDLIIFTNPGLEYPRFLKKLAVNIFHRDFDDIEMERDSFKPPSKQDVQDILTFSEGRYKLLCACHMGRSRSSAAAYLILCSRIKPSDAITVLDPDQHSPNQLMVHYGAEILDNPKVEEEFKEWTKGLGKRDWMI